MDSLDPASPAAAEIGAASRPPPGVWKFWGTTFWGVAVFYIAFNIWFYVMCLCGKHELAEQAPILPLSILHTPSMEDSKFIFSGPWKIQSS